MKRLYLILLLATMAQSAAALTRQQEQVISATGFALFVGDYYYPACDHYELDDETVQSAWRTSGLSPDRYMEKTHFRGNRLWCTRCSRRQAMPLLFSCHEGPE